MNPIVGKHTKEKMSSMKEGKEKDTTSEETNCNRGKEIRTMMLDLPKTMQTHLEHQSITRTQGTDLYKKTLQNELEQK